MRNADQNTGETGDGLLSKDQSIMEYQGYTGEVEFDDGASIFHGRVTNTRDVITFQAHSVSVLETAFRDSIDDYLSFCRERGEEPDKPL
jgi:predicted HicB family RNase H-like nuclease